MTGFVCHTCGQYHDTLPTCFGPSAPALWHTIPEAERATRGELSSDQCVIDDKHFFILGRILIPIVDRDAASDVDEHFIWLAWVSLSERNFLRVCELWETDGRESEPPYFGWLQSELPYDASTLALETSVLTMPVGERPSIVLAPGAHPLALEQQHGITMARVRELAERCLHGAAG